MIVVYLHVILLLDGVHRATGACSTNECTEEVHGVQVDAIQNEDLVFLQVNNSIAHMHEENAPTLSSLAHHAAKGGKDIAERQNLTDSRLSLVVLDAKLTALLGRSGVSAGWIVVNVALVLLAFGLCGYCFTSSSFLTWKGSQRLAKKAAPPKDQVEAVEPPILCPDLTLPNSEARFVIEKKVLSEHGKKNFPVFGPSGFLLLEAKIEEGRILCLCSPGSDQPRVMMQAPRSLDIHMLNILGGEGRYFGKLALDPNGEGFTLYHMNKPSVRIRVTDAEKLQMVAEPLAGPGQVLAQVHCHEDTLRCQVRSGVDGVLFLASFLGILVLKPAMLQEVQKK
eukprot:TRINITY_DN95499_c0_g1_i1.p1 TRINITY_DN95499_c0_g1~~TRINITY_DN95499_c0_g1_i1.p1  ORF type:complete len:338 (-),score=67.41 TRINITY_DN95499_c0_g1_i1:13-1026(-)